MAKVLNVAGHPIDLDNGRTLAPGEEAKANPDHPHNQALIVRGHVIVLTEEPRKQADPDTGKDKN